MSGESWRAWFSRWTKTGRRHDDSYDPAIISDDWRLADRRRQRQHTGAAHPAVEVQALPPIVLLPVHVGAVTFMGCRRVVLGALRAGRHRHRRSAHAADRRKDKRDQQDELKEAANWHRIRCSNGHGLEQPVANARHPISSTALIAVAER
jgi:hypothetical protein